MIVLEGDGEEGAVGANYVTTFTLKEQNRLRGTLNYFWRLSEEELTKLEISPEASKVITELKKSMYHHNGENDAGISMDNDGNFVINGIIDLMEIDENAVMNIVIPPTVMGELKSVFNSQNPSGCMALVKKLIRNLVPSLSNEKGIKEVQLDALSDIYSDQGSEFGEPRFRDIPKVVPIDQIIGTKKD